MKQELADYLNSQTEILKKEQKVVKSKVSEILALISSVSCLTINDSPLLNSWEICDEIGEEDNEVLNFNWTDGEGLDYSVTITEGGIASANFNKHNLKLNDSEGNHTVISIYSLEPVKFVKTWW